MPLDSHSSDMRERERATTNVPSWIQTGDSMVPGQHLNL